MDCLDAPVEFGGQGLPHVLKFIVDEIVCSTNLSLRHVPRTYPRSDQRAARPRLSPNCRHTYLHKLISGDWTGTMCLTEPQCGTDLGMIRTRATPNDDGTYSISGTKIWITGGEHDLSDNIVHLVLAKLPGAPDSTKGISLVRRTQDVSRQWGTKFGVLWRPGTQNGYQGIVHLRDEF